MTLNCKTPLTAIFVGGPLDGQELRVDLVERVEVAEQPALDLSALPGINSESKRKIHRYRLMYGYYQYDGYYCE